MRGHTFEENVILNSVSDGITVNSKGVLLYVNEPFAKMVGYNVSELIGMNILAVTAPEYHERVIERTNKRQKGLKTDPLYSVELVRKDGTRIPVEYNVSHIEYEGKSSSLTIIRDISERVLSRLDYIPILNKLNEAIAIYDNERYIWVNDAYAKLRGYDSSDEINGTSIFIGVHPEESQEQVRVIAERSRSGGSTIGVWRIKNKDGSYQKVTAHSSMLPTFEKPVSVAIVRPVDNGNVDIVPKMNTANIHHGIHSALTVIVGYLELIQFNVDELNSPEEVKWFKIIHKNVLKIEEILKEIN